MGGWIVHVFIHLHCIQENRCKNWLIIWGRFLCIVVNNLDWITNFAWFVDNKVVLCLYNLSEKCKIHHYYLISAGFLHRWWRVSCRKIERDSSMNATRDEESSGIHFITGSKMQYIIQLTIALYLYKMRMHCFPPKGSCNKLSTKWESVTTSHLAITNHQLTPTPLSNWWFFERPMCLTIM